MKETRRVEDLECEDFSQSASNNGGSSLPNNGSGRRLRLQHLSAATGLILTYLIEIGVQIFLTIHCCRSLIMLTLNWDWPWFVTMSLTMSSLLVSSVSLVWVCHSLDFAGKLCGRLLCYVMHFFLLGLPWRYLKLAFAYDPADVQEFVALRIFQVYIQSLPLTSIHLAWFITFHENWTNPVVWLVVTEAMSIVTALIIASYMTPCRTFPEYEFSKKNVKTTKHFLENIKCGPSNEYSVESVMWLQILKIELNLVSRALLLCCRLVAMGILISNLKYWTSIGIVSHLFISFTWIRLRHKLFVKSIFDDHKIIQGNNLSVRRTLEFVYILFWDITTTICGELKFSTWYFLSGLVLFENLIIFCYFYLQSKNLNLILLIGSGSCLIFGIILFLLLNLCNLNYITQLFGTRIHEMKKSDRRSSFTIEITKTEILENNEESKDSKSNHSTLIPSTSSSTSTTEISKIKNKITSWGFMTSWKFGQEKTKPFIMPNNYLNISEVLTTEKEIKRPNSRNSHAQEKPQIDTRSHHMTFQPQKVQVGDTLWSPHNDNPTCTNLHPFGGTCGGSSVPDTCCNDSNGSSNSRNTNTIAETMPQDRDEVDTHGTTHFVFCYPADGGRSKSHYQSNNEISSHLKSPNQKLSLSTHQIQTSTPVEIKRASRVIMNIPKHLETKSRCPCQKSVSPLLVSKTPNRPTHDKLMESSYGILFCEGEHESLGMKTGRQIRNFSSAGTPVQNNFYKKLRVLCAKCLQNHDPLLTDCQDEEIEKVTAPLPPITSIITVMSTPDRQPLPSETTDYPSETEMTWTALDEDEEVESVVTSLHSTATYTTLLCPQMWNVSTMSSQGMPKEFTSREYVRTWLLTSQARQRHLRHQQKVAKSANQNHGVEYANALSSFVNNIGIEQRQTRVDSVGVNRNSLSSSIIVAQNSPHSVISTNQMPKSADRGQTPTNDTLNSKCFFKDLEIIV